MKGILRTATLFYASSSLQRWLTAAGLVLIGYGHLSFLTARAAVELWPVLGIVLGLAVSLVPIGFVSGVLFRSLSAPRTVRLIPYGRLQLLIALPIAALGAALFVTANLALVAIEAPTTALARTSLMSMFVGTFGGETLLMLGTFVGSSSPHATPILIAAFLIGQTQATRLVRSFAALISVSLTSLSALLVGGAWFAFALWYLRARWIAPPKWGEAFSPTEGRGAKREVRIAISRDSATTVQLLGLYSVTSLAWRGALVIVGVALAWTLMWFRRPEGSAALNVGAFILFQVALVVGVQAVGVAWGIARRSRLLWIQSGCTRSELFRLCERLSWYCFAAISAPIFLICVAVWILLLHTASDWPYFLLATFAPAICALYLGLMNVRGWRIIEITVAVLIVLVAMPSVVIEMSSVRSFQPALVLIPTAELLGALALRFLAQRRWRQIDWLICKPQRMSSQALRSV